MAARLSFGEPARRASSLTSRLLTWGDESGPVGGDRRRPSARFEIIGLDGRVTAQMILSSTGDSLTEAPRLDQLLRHRDDTCIGPILRPDLDPIKRLGSEFLGVSRLEDDGW